METKIQNNEIDYSRLGISGLGGWLVLVQIGIYGTLLSVVLRLLLNSIPMFMSEAWVMFTSKSSEYYHALWAPIIIFELIYDVLLVIFCIYILIKFYSKSWILPRLMIILYAAGFLVSLVGYIALEQIPLVKELESGNSIRDLIRPLLTCLIWIPYFLKSERVKNTFIR